MRIKNILLTSVVSASAAFSAGSAQAQEIVTINGPATVEKIYGYGASLPAPYFRSAANCFSADLPLVFTGPPPADPTSQNVDPFSYNAGGVSSQNCATTDYITNREVHYMSTGSGTGINTFFSHSPALPGDTDPAAGVQLYPRVTFALSETALGATQVNTYNNGGTAPISVKGPANPGGTYDNPRDNYGALIQFPILVAPVTIAYDPIYKKRRNAAGEIDYFMFRNKWERADQSGGLHLDQAAVCDIFNGVIQNWKDIPVSLNKGASLRQDGDTATFSVPLQIVGREDSSGTTSLWTRFLAKACEGRTGNAYANSTSRLPGRYFDSANAAQGPVSPPFDLVGAVWNKSSDNFGAGAVYYNTTDNGTETTGKYTVANGNDGVAKYIDFTQDPTATVGDVVVQGRIGYVGPDYVLPGSLATGTNSYDLKTADVKNLRGYFVAPTVAGALQSFRDAIIPEASQGGGGYIENAACTAGTAAVTVKCRNRPQDWVEPADKASPLANPATYIGSYPIVGTTNALVYTCYRQATSKGSVVSFFKNFYFSSLTVNDTTPGTEGILAAAGLAPLPNGWKNAIKNTFFDSTNSLGLAVGSKSLDAKCSALTGA